MGESPQRYVISIRRHTGLPTPPGVRRPSHSDAFAHIAQGRDLPDQTVIFDSCVNHGITQGADLWDFEQAHIDVLQKPRDASDPLSPALLYSSATAPLPKP